MQRLKKNISFIITVCVHNVEDKCMCVPWCMCRGQRTASQNQFMGPGIKLGLSCQTSTCWVTSLAFSTLVVCNSKERFLAHIFVPKEQGKKIKKSKKKSEDFFCNSKWEEGSGLNRMCRHFPDWLREQNWGVRHKDGHHAQPVGWRKDAGERCSVAKSRILRTGEAAHQLFVNSQIRKFLGKMITRHKS